MFRTPRLTQRFQARRLALGLKPSESMALARTIAALSREPLPGPQDHEALMPPVARYWFRRVLTANLWLWFAFDDRELVLVSLTRQPPVPAD